MNLKANIGAVDQWLRLSLGFLLVFCAAAGILGPWAYVGIVPLVTALISFCPLYALLGFRGTRRKS